MKGHKVRGYVLATALIAVGVLAWLFLAPPQLGGSTSYVVITGNSMEPLLHEGDLAIVRESPSYALGDVVAYESDDLGRLVLHRIVGHEEARIVLKGDNNDFLDAERPSMDQVQGQLGAHVPYVGIAFRFLQGPIGMGAGAIAMLGLLGTFSARRRHRSRSVPPSKLTVVPGASRRSPPPPPPRKAVGTSGARRNRSLLKVVTSVSGVAMLVFGTLAAFAFSRPPAMPVSEDILLDHSARFSYSASAPVSSAYDGPTVTTGEPVFVRLADEVMFTVDYVLSSEVPIDATSTGRIKATLGADNGLSRTIPLTSEAAHGGMALKISAEMSLRRLRTIVRRIESETGVEAGIYTVTVTPDVEVVGSVGTEPVETSFLPQLAMEFDSLQLRSSRGVAEGESPFTVKKTESVASVSQGPNDLVVLGRGISMNTVGRSSMLGGGAAMAILIVGGIVLVGTRPKDEQARIAARSSSPMISVTEVPSHVDAVEVTDFSTLARVAHQFELAILHASFPTEDIYMVPHGAILYRYRCQTRLRAPRAAERGTKT